MYPLKTKKSKYSPVDKLYFDCNYQEYIHSPAWLSKRAYFLAKYQVCNKCGRKATLHLHHTNYKNLGNEKDEDIEVLCNTCHWFIHKQQKSIKSFKKDIKKILNNRARKIIRKYGIEKVIAEIRNYYEE